MVGHLPGRREILLQQRRRHRQRFARVVEARLVGRIDRKLARRPNVDARQIANRVVVLGVAQPPGQHDAGIARIALRQLVRSRRIHAITACRSASVGCRFASSGGISFASSRSSTVSQRR